MRIKYLVQNGNFGHPNLIFFGQGEICTIYHGINYIFVPVHNYRQSIYECTVFRFQGLFI